MNEGRISVPEGNEHPIEKALRTPVTRREALIGSAGFIAGLYAWMNGCSGERERSDEFPSPPPGAAQDSAQELAWLDEVVETKERPVIEVLNELFADIDGISIVRKESLPPDLVGQGSLIAHNERFSIYAEERKERVLKGGEWKLNDPDGSDNLSGQPMKIEDDGSTYQLRGAEYIDKPALTIVIGVEDNFTYRDIPEIIKGLEQAHNNWLKQRQGDEGGDRDGDTLGAILDATKVIAREYRFWAGQVSGFAKNHPDWQKQMEKYHQWLLAVASFYDPQGQGIKSDKELKTLGEQIEPGITHIEAPGAHAAWEKIATKPKRLERMQTPEGEKQVFAALDRLVARLVKRELRRDLVKATFQRGEEELWRLSDVPDIFKENFSTDKWPEYKEYFAYYNIQEWKRLEDIQAACANERDSDKKLKLLRDVKRVMDVIFSKDHFLKYDAASYSFKDLVRKKYYNCMAVSGIEQLLWKKMFDVDVMGGHSDRHFFIALPHPKGEFYDNLVIPHNITLASVLKGGRGLQYDVDGQWYVLGDFRLMYASAIHNQNAIEQSNRGNRRLALACIDAALEIIPDDVMYKHNKRAIEYFT